MREYLALLEPLLAGERVEYAGERYRVSLQLGTLGASRLPCCSRRSGPRCCGSRARPRTAPRSGSARRAISSVRDPGSVSAARDAGRPAPRIACGFPIAVTRDVSAARESAELLLSRSSKLPAYQRVLERGGLERPADAAIIGDDTTVIRALDRLAGLGVTDLTAATFDVAGDPGARARTQALLAERSRARRSD